MANLRFQGGYGSGFHEKLLEASSVFDGANASWLQELLLPKTGPISDGGTAFETTDLTRG